MIKHQQWLMRARMVDTHVYEPAVGEKYTVEPPMLVGKER